MDIEIELEPDFPDPSRPGSATFNAATKLRRPGRPRGDRVLVVRPDHEPTVMRVAMALAWGEMDVDDRSFFRDRAEWLLRDLQAVLP